MKPSKHRVLLLGILSPVLAVILYALVYGVLTRFSHDLEKDWLFRLSASTLAMTIPFLFTAALAIADRRSQYAVTIWKNRTRSRNSLTRTRLEARERWHSSLETDAK